MIEQILAKYKIVSYEHELMWAYFDVSIRRLEFNSLILKQKSCSQKNWGLSWLPI